MAKRGRPEKALTAAEREIIKNATLVAERKAEKVCEYYRNHLNEVVKKIKKLEYNQGILINFYEKIHKVLTEPPRK